MWCLMRPIYPIVILFLLAAVSSAQLSPDKDRFDVVLHPGDLVERTLKVTNTGDSTIHEISRTEMSGTAKGYIFLDMPEEEPLVPGDEAEIKIFFVLPPEIEPGTYTGFLYLLDSAPPSLPIRIEFDLTAIAQESYGMSMTINDAKSADISAGAEDIAEFDLAVNNLGAFRDVASIDCGPLPEGWSASLLDGEKTVEFPYDLALDPSATHSMKLHIETTKPGRRENLTITATSLGNRSKNSSVEAKVSFAVEVRGYSVDIMVPETLVVNRTYKGSFKILLDVEEEVMVGIITPSDLMVIPSAQIVKVSPKRPGIANFTMLASGGGEYPLIFRLMDSHGIPMPEETATINVVQPKGMAVLTGDDFLYSTIVSASRMGNETVDFDLITTEKGRIQSEDLEKLQEYSEVLILGNESIVSDDVEGNLNDAGIKRIGGDSLYEQSWIYAADIWINGSESAVLCGTTSPDLFRAYQIAQASGMPMVVCQGQATEKAKAAVAELAGKNITLNKALYIGDIDMRYLQPLNDAGIETEEVRA